MSDVDPAIIGAASALLGVGVGIAGQIFTARFTVNETRRHALADFQRATLLELQDGPIPAAIEWLDGMHDAVLGDRELLDRHDFTDGGDPIWDALYRRVAPVRRLQFRIEDDECRALIDSFLGEFVEAFKDIASTSRIGAAHMAQQKLNERIGELIRSR